jgi:hypothetical protein
MRKEFRALINNSTWELMPLPPGQSTVSTCWVLQIKPDSTLKARFVTCSFSQLEGIDYNETYTPVLHL